MKFFYKYNNNKTILKNHRDNQQRIHINPPTLLDSTSLSNFINFLTKKGLYSKEKTTFTGILKNFNFFLYQNTDYLHKNYPDIK